MQTQTASQTITEVSTPVPAKSPSLYDLARRHLDDAGNDVAEATEALVDLLCDDAATLRSVLRPVIEEAARTTVGDAMRAERKAILGSYKSRTDAAGRAAVAALASGITRSLLDFPLAGGVRLRDASRTEVEEQAGLYEAFASDQARKARWLRAVADRMGTARKVADALDEATITELFESA